jgi:cytochrome c-type biogenesis protein
VEIVREWYLLLSRLSASLSGPLGGLADRIQVAPLSAFLFGLMGATTPCQITTNLSAIAYVSRELGSKRPWQEAAAYILGKLLVSTLIGGVIIGLGQQIQGAAISVAVVTRRLLGPVMLLIALVFMDVLKFRMSLGHGVAKSLQSRLVARGPWGAFLLGVIFAFAFCPTLFLLFFGLTIPLGFRSRAGLLIPGLFAIGTSVPLLAYGGLMAMGSDLGERYLRGVARNHAPIQKIAGVIFLLVGIIDTLGYWFL